MIPRAEVGGVLHFGVKSTLVAIAGGPVSVQIGVDTGLADLCGDAVKLDLLVHLPIRQVDQVLAVRAELEAGQHVAAKYE